MAIATNSNPFELQVIALAICCQLLSPTKAIADGLQVKELLHGQDLYRGALIPDVFPKYRQNRESVLIPSSMPVPASGISTSAMTMQDEKFVKFMRKWQIPGAQVAIAKDGKLLSSKAYGWSNIEKKKPISIDSLFRIASVSKAITAVCTLKLVDQQKIKLDAKVMNILSYPDFKRGNHDYDERLDAITVTNLLQCTGGWDRRRGDPMFAPILSTATQEYSRTLRPNSDSALRYALRMPLTYEPGSHYSYSNVGYGLLGQIIRTVTKTPYETVVREQVLQPIGITNMRLGKTLQAAPNEVTYYPFPGQELNRSLFPNFRGAVPLSYGGDFALEAVESDCGWLASAQDLCAFANSALGEGGKQSLLSPKMKALMVKQPDVPEWKSKGVYFGMGWEVAPNKDPKKVIVFRQGSIPGSLSVVARRGDGIVWSFVLNTRPKAIYHCQSEITALIWETVDQAQKLDKKSQ